jgi:hypothetical protein
MSYKKFLVAADNHGSLVSEEAKKKILDFAKSWKPNYKIHLGDLWDFSPLRRGCSPEEKADGISEDYQMGLEFLDAFKPDYLTLGNHDDRIWMNSTKCADGMLREHCAKLAQASEDEFRKRKIKWVPYHISKYLVLPEGGPKFIHGFKSSIHAAKAHYDGWGSVIHGHVHAPATYYARHIDGGMAFSVGCLADIEQMTYADRYQAKHGWRQGFLFGLINTKTGSWQAWHATNEDGIWVSPHGIL